MAAGRAFCSRGKIPVSRNNYEVLCSYRHIVFYEVAMSREDSYLVTGNLKHFPHNGRVVSPSDMLYIMEYGEKGPGLLNEPEGPYYLPIPLDEINAIIREVRMKIQG